MLTSPTPFFVFVFATTVHDKKFATDVLALACRPVTTGGDVETAATYEGRARVAATESPRDFRYSESCVSRTCNSMLIIADM